MSQPHSKQGFVAWCKGGGRGTDQGQGEDLSPLYPYKANPPSLRAAGRGGWDFIAPISSPAPGCCSPSSPSAVKMRNLLLALLLACGESVGEDGVSSPPPSTYKPYGLTGFERLLSIGFAISLQCSGWFRGLGDGPCWWHSVPMSLPAGLPPARGSMLELERMIRVTTGKSALLSYSWYGCFCGIGGRGTPVDPTDT